MVTITQPKIAGLEPRWAPFAGFSLLFDNPADAERRALYTRLQDTLHELGVDRLASDFLFCALPPASYHVTVWDGVNAANLASVAAALRAEWRAYLESMPEASHPGPSSIAVVRDSRLARGPRAPLQFGFDDLALWGHQALVARLRPSDEDAAAGLVELCAARDALSAEARQALGVSPERRYEPHVTLGYFANEGGGRRAGAHLAAWNERFQERLAGVTIEFASIGVYTFPDMANFHRR